MAAHDPYRPAGCTAVARTANFLLARLRRLGLDGPVVEGISGWWARLDPTEAAAWRSALAVLTDSELTGDWAPALTPTRNTRQVQGWVVHHRVPDAAAVVALAVERTRREPRLMLIDWLEAGEW